MGGGVSSLNMQLRKELDLYASLANCFDLPGLPTRHENVDIVVVRESTMGEYSGLEHDVVPSVVESLKVITKFCSERIAKYAFECAYLNSRKKVTAVHQANIMKLADGASVGNVGNEKLVEQKTAKPLALLPSSAMMLRHFQFPSFADHLETAVKRVILEGNYRPKDLGGTSTTQEFTSQFGLTGLIDTSSFLHLLIFRGSALPVFFTP